MSARKPKPTKLKEQSPLSNGEAKLGLSQLFAPANALVSFEPPLQRSPIVSPTASALANDDKTLKLEVLTQPSEPPADSDESTKVSLALTRASRLNRAHTARADGAEPRPSEPVPERTSATKVKSPRSRKVKKENQLGPWLLLIPAVALFSYVALAPLGFNGSKHSRSSPSQLTQTQIQERLDFHRDLTGSRLNRERIDVQLQNHLDAPGLPLGARKIKAPDMMNGLPLAGEQTAFSRGQKSDWPVNPSHPDAKIMYGLQEEQDRVYFERLARKAWLNDFVENARKDGYAVQIDKFGNVKTKRIPDAEREPSSNTETGVNSSATTDTLIDY